MGYIAKYAGKGEAGIHLVSADGRPLRFPKGCRIHGRSGLDQAQRHELSWWLMPKYVRDQFPDLQDCLVRRASGGGWVDRLTGAFTSWATFQASTHES